MFYDDIVHEFGEIMHKSAIAEFRKITQNNDHFAVEGHRHWYQSKAHIRLLIKMIAGMYCALSLEFMNLLGIYTVGVARYLCRRLLLDIVIVNCPWLWLYQPLLPNTPIKLPNSVKITHNKGHFAVQGHSRSPMLVPIESSYTTSY